MKQYLKYTLIFCFSVSFQFAYSQLDLAFHYQKPDFQNWDNTLNDYYQDQSKIFNHAYGASVAYRYYPWNFRLGLIPEIAFTYSERNRSDASLTNSYQLIEVALSPSVQLFPFDFYGDCDCPTFGKQNDFFQKAFYFKLIPQIGYHFLKSSLSSNLTKNNFVFGVGMGAGLNVAVNNMLTIAPEISYNRDFLVRWDGLSDNHENPDSNDDSKASNIRIGLRFSFYFE